MAARPRVVVTGANGVVGKVLCASLADEFDVVGVDLRRSGRKEISRVDMTRIRAAERALEGADVLIDLASAHWQQPWAKVHRNNLPAAWNALEAARRGGVRRVLSASSNHVTGLYERDEPYDRIVEGRYDGLDPAGIAKIDTSMAVRPDSPYAVGKVMVEAAGRYYAESHGLSVFCLRIGSLNVAGRPTEVRHFATLITHRDMSRLVRACILAPADVPFRIFYGVSANTWRFWDIEDARQEIGYEPRDDAEAWRKELDVRASGTSGIAATRRRNSVRRLVPNRLRNLSSRLR
jgi:uronate dehydrogenase